MTTQFDESGLVKFGPIANAVRKEFYDHNQMLYAVEWEMCPSDESPLGVDGQSVEADGGPEGFQ